MLVSFSQWFYWQRVPASQIEFKAINRETSFLLRYALFYIIAGYALGLVIATSTLSDGTIR
jgi:hypothetical protein